MNAEGRIAMTEEELSNTISISSLPWARGKELLQLPEVIQGLSILDVGGGASEITATLLEMGANAFAIDPRYKKKSEISAMMKFHLQRGQYELQRRIAINKSFQKFMASIDAAPDRYRAASGTQIPFADNTFDLVFSIDTVTAFLDVDRKILLDCLQECIRVTKPGGQLQFLPFQDMQPNWQPAINLHRVRNDDHALTWLKNHPQVEQIEISVAPVHFHHRLCFRKKAAS